MRRRRGRRTFLTLCLACAAAALFAPRLGGLRTAAAAAFVPVSHPARAVGGGMAGLFEGDGPIDPESPRRPRDARAVYAENQALRQQAADLLVQVQRLKALNRDRDSLGTSLRDRCTPARVVASLTDGGQALQLGPGHPAAAGMRVLFSDRGAAGLVGTVVDANPAGARVRLITDPDHPPFDARFVKVEDGRVVATLDTLAFAVSGAGGGRCEVRRHQQKDLDDFGVEAGTWAVLSDDRWPEPAHGLRVARVVAIEPLDQAPGFARVVMEPAADLTALGEVMVLARL